MKNKRKVCGLITFSIGDNIDKFIRDDPWGVVEDTSDGNICYIEQFLSDKGEKNQKYSRQVLNDFMNHIKNKFPNVESVCWRRFKNNGIHIFHKTIRRKELCMISRF